MELRIFLEQFATRIESVRPAGDASRTHASFVDGYEPLPINWTLRQRSYGEIWFSRGGGAAPSDLTARQDFGLGPHPGDNREGSP